MFNLLLNYNHFLAHGYYAISRDLLRGVPAGFASRHSILLMKPHIENLFTSVLRNKNCLNDAAGKDGVIYKSTL